MTRIYRTSDRLNLRIDNVQFKLAPLTLSQKKEIQSYLYKSVNEQDMMAAQEGTILAVKYSVKSVKGLFDNNQEPYQIEIEDGVVTDKCLDELLNIEIGEKLSNVCSSLIYGISTKIIDPLTNKEMEGVSFEESAEKKNLEESIS